MKALSAAVVSASAGIIVPCVAGSSGSHYISSWWHAMDGIPILMDRRPERKMSVNAYSSVAHHPEGSAEWLAGPAAHGRFLEFGDYVDPTFSCPATVTCPDVCVASAEYCPEDAICPGTHPDNEGDPDHEYEVGYEYMYDYVLFSLQICIFVFSHHHVLRPRSYVSTGHAPISQQGKNAIQERNLRALAGISLLFARNKSTCTPIVRRDSKNYTMPMTCVWPTKRKVFPG
jgi:hypothetical protein